jgi:hypothetical protein
MHWLAVPLTGALYPGDGRGARSCVAAPVPLPRNPLTDNEPVWFQSSLISLHFQRRGMSLRAYQYFRNALISRLYFRPVPI